MADLEELRIMLDQMNEKIVSKLKDRSRLPLNLPVYEPDVVRINGRHGISFLEFAIEGLEAYHASLGRYEYRDQHPLLGKDLPASPVERAGTNTALSGIEIGIGGELVGFYRTVLPELCRNGDAPRSYGETVYIDADLLQLMHERINTVGRYVAQSKFDMDPAIRQHADDPETLRSMLRDGRREEAVIGKVKETATRYGLDQKITERIFNWLMSKTLEVETVYLQRLARDESATAKVASKSKM